ncbi:hypothetical protein B0H12DRAFT_1123252 [Mycena haematopus]|nr:hypothetical protein B0H12DRAFT_1123252 [Mycena haematopus]
MYFMIDLLHRIAHLGCSGPLSSFCPLYHTRVWASWMASWRARSSVAGWGLVVMLLGLSVVYM